MTAETWIAIATVVNAGTVVGLAFITFWYARSANRQAQATEEIARASVQQSAAAQQQATSAQQQATAALQTLGELREQMAMQRITAHQVVAAAVATAISQIEHWEGSGVIESRAQHAAIPKNLSLLPTNHAFALECAARLSQETLLTLNRAFNLLHRAHAHIEGMRRDAGAGFEIDFVKPESHQARELLSESKSILMRLQTDIFTSSN